MSDKRREFWIRVNKVQPNNPIAAFTTKGGKPSNIGNSYEEIYTLEAKPGEKMFSREQVENAFVGVFGDYKNGVEQVHVEKIDKALNELFAGEK